MSEPEEPAADVQDEPAQRLPDASPPNAPGAGPARRADPEQTSDDTDLGWGEIPDSERDREQTEQWLRAQRPPHWE